MHLVCAVCHGMSVFFFFFLIEMECEFEYLTLTSADVHELIGTSMTESVIQKLI